MIYVYVICIYLGTGTNVYVPVYPIYMKYRKATKHRHIEEELKLKEIICDYIGLIIFFHRLSLTSSKYWYMQH